MNANFVNYTTSFPQQKPGLFGQPSSNNSSPFGSNINAPSTAKPSDMGPASQSQHQSVFGNSVNNVNTIESAPQSQQYPSFGVASPNPSSNLFGQPAPNASTLSAGLTRLSESRPLFGQPTGGSSLFSSRPASSSLFGAPQQAYQSSSIFGAPPPSGSSLFASVRPPQSIGDQIFGAAARPSPGPMFGPPSGSLFAPRTQFSFSQASPPNNIFRNLSPLLPGNAREPDQYSPYQPQFNQPIINRNLFQPARVDGENMIHFLALDQFKFSDKTVEEFRYEDYIQSRRVRPQGLFSRNNAPSPLKPLELKREPSTKHQIPNSFSSSIFEDIGLSDKFTCSICMQVPCCKLAVEHPGCGKVFCEECIRKWLAKENVCPCCRLHFGTCVFLKESNKLAYYIFGALKVKCFMKEGEEGCSWKGEFTHLDNHIKESCLYCYAFCKNGCGTEKLRKELEQHETEECGKRNIECKFCGQ